jgi:DNA-binding Lrp family transcriptional regulator
MSHDGFTVDELDLRIVHALQVSPRAPWSLVASVIGADRATVMRRWRRMEEAGAAWITCYPVLSPEHTFTLVELSCIPGRTLQVAARLAADPHAVSVMACSGSSDLEVDVITRDHRNQARYVLERLAAIEGIRKVRTHQAAAYHHEASRWRLGLLDAAAEGRLAAHASPPAMIGQKATNDPGTAITEAQRDIVGALASAPRMPTAELAARLGVSRATAHRRLTELLSAQPVMRCELAQSLTPWPVTATFFLRCPADKIDVTAQALSRLRNVRAVLATVGHRNLCFAAWVPSISHVVRMESQLVTRMPHVQVTERSFVTRPVKLMGQLLDEDGWRTGTVPIDVRRNPLELI